MNDTYDEPWKEAIDTLFPDFIAFFLPPAFAAIDWQRGHEPLPTVLEQIVARNPHGGQAVDRLVKVWRTDGSPAAVYLHIEVQSQRDAGFSERVATYHWRIRATHPDPVVTLVVLGDEDAAWRPSGYTSALWGCTLTLAYPVVKLLDYREQHAALLADPNPFGRIVLAHLATQRTRRDPPTRLQTKLALMRDMYARGYDREYIIRLFRFINWLMQLPPELEDGFYETLRSYEEEYTMPYVTSLEQRAMDRGREEGRAEGIAVGREEGRAEGIAVGREQGLAQGREQGREQGLERGLERGLEELALLQLTTRFGALDEATVARVQALSVAALRELAVALLAFTVPADLTAWLDAHAPEAGDV